MKNEEYHIQKSVVQYIKMQYPKALITIAPSGNKLPLGVARRFKMMGYQAGSPDLMVFESRCGYHGLFIEIKTPKGRLTMAQKEFLKALKDRGYLAVVAYGFDEAIAVIDKYMKNGI